MTQIMSHGKWITYAPEKWPEWAPRNAMFCRRENDGADWYDYVQDEKSFSADSVKFAVTRQGTDWIIGPAVRDATRMYPADQVVLEIIDYHGEDPQEELGGRLFDIGTNRLLDRPPPPIPPDLILFREIWQRLKVIEAKLGIAP
jgi:hypothetical protein